MLPLISRHSLEIGSYFTFISKCEKKPSFYSIMANVKRLLNPVIFFCLYMLQLKHAALSKAFGGFPVSASPSFPPPPHSHFSHKDPFPALKAVCVLLPLIPYTQDLPTWTFSYLCPRNTQVSFMAQLTSHQPSESS